MKSKLSYAAYGAVAGAIIAYVLHPKPTSIKTEQTAAKIEYRTVTQERVVERPGGIKETIRTITDNSVKTESSKKTDIKTLKPNWLVGASAGLRVNDPTLQYGLQVQRRVIGPVFAGGYVRMDGEFGIAITAEF